MKRRPIEALVRRIDKLEDSPLKRGRGRPLTTLKDIIKKDLEINGLSESMVYDRAQWRRLIHVADPT